MTSTRIRRARTALLLAAGSIAAAAALLAACASDPSSSSPSTLPSVPAGSAAEPSPTPRPTRSATPAPRLAFEQETFGVPPGSAPHDVAPARDGGVWYTAQGSGELGWLDPESGDVREIPLGAGSAPHGVIVGPDGAPWITDGGMNAIVRVDPETEEVRAYALPPSAPGANLNTAAFDGDGILWFTGQAGYYGSLDPDSGRMRVHAAPRGAGPYGIAATPEGDIYFSSLAGSYLGAVNRRTGEVLAIDPPTAGAGLRRVWSDSRGRLWVSEWFAGQVGVYDPADRSWREWPLPGSGAQAYGVYVDETDAVWVTDFTSDAIVRFDPRTRDFLSLQTDDGRRADVRQLLGREGEVWGAESAADQLVVIRYSG